MYFVYLFLWNFIIGGVTGIYLSDVPADQYFHGDMFVTAHFHYTLLGGAMIAAMAGALLLVPEGHGQDAERADRQGGLLDHRHRDPDHLLRDVLGGLPGHAPSGRPTTTRSSCGPTRWPPVGAYLLMLGWIVLLYAIIHSGATGKPAPANPWHAKTLEWKVPTPVPLENFLVDPVVTSDPYGYGEPEPGGSDRRPTRTEPDPELVPTSGRRRSRDRRRR